MTKYCICITGQLRSPQVLLPAIARATTGIDARFVFSIWDRIGRKVDGALNVHQLPRIFETNAMGCLPFDWYGAGNLWKAMPSLFSELHSQSGPADTAGLRALILSHFPDSVVDIEDAALMDLEFSEPREDRNSLRMFYKIWRANEIARRLNRDEGGFDVVIRIRPDIDIKGLDFAQLEQRVNAGEFLVDIWRDGYCGDLFAAGSPDDMSVYASTFSRTLAHPLQWRLTHTDLYEVLSVGGLNVANLGGTRIAPEAEGRIKAGQLIAHLTAPTPRHRIVRATAQAADLLEQGRADEALVGLVSVLGIPELYLPRAANGWLYQLAVTLQDLCLPGPAALAAWAITSRRVYPNSPPGNVLNRIVQSQLCIRADGRGIARFSEPENLLSWLQEHREIASVLDSHIGMSVEDFVTQGDVLSLDDSMYLLRKMAQQRSSRFEQLALGFLRSEIAERIDDGQRTELVQKVRGCDTDDVQE